ncbi:class I SAM-dependent methyltransferase [Aquihabitans sp. McL0605]|uniref:class I SAM-dependent methyltransferase n=1 Tax=Aquihabitans sp. McL0605 TaxID=3415671 RepID=UPI003CFB7D69
MNAPLLSALAATHAIAPRAAWLTWAGRAAVLPALVSRPERINRSAWTSRTTLRQFARSEGWSDPGEREAIESVKARAAGGAILDIGVGAGRTVPLLREISDDYRAIDFLAPMVEECAKRFPDVDVAVGDARDLSRFGDGELDLVVFSWNGIDAVEHGDRAQILAEVHRVLAPGGTFQFSTHNIAGRGWQETPWTVHKEDLGHPRRLAELAVYLPINARNHHRNRVNGPHGDGWGMANAGAHHFSLVIHYTTLGVELDELADAGFEHIEVWDNETGRPVLPGQDTSGTWWFQLAARKAVEPPEAAAAASTGQALPGADTYHRAASAPLTERADNRTLRPPS